MAVVSLRSMVWPDDLCLVDEFSVVLILEHCRFGVACDFKEGCRLGSTSSEIKASPGAVALVGLSAVTDTG